MLLCLSIKKPKLLIYQLYVWQTSNFRYDISGADPGFQVRGGGAHLRKLRRAEGGAKIFGVFRAPLPGSAPVYVYVHVVDLSVVLIIKP